MTLVDTAIATGKAVTSTWDAAALPPVRAALEYAIFASLHTRLKRIDVNHYHTLFMDACPEEEGPVAISLNYDTLVDRAMIELSAWLTNGRLPEYGCALNTPRGRNQQGRKGFGQLYKLHGSVDWFRCYVCTHLELAPSDLDIYRMVVPEAFLTEAVLEARYEAAARRCSRCGGSIGPLLIAPTQRKIYGSEHLDQIWQNAEDALRRAEKVYLIGYSLPDDDVEVSLLLRRSLDHLAPSQITVVQYDQQRRGLRQHPDGRRYSALLGAVDWRTDGFVSWLEEQRRSSAWLRRSGA
jgi:NAD-dependent SIR2 family protein deacetylase